MKWYTRNIVSFIFFITDFGLDASFYNQAPLNRGIVGAGYDFSRSRGAGSPPPSSQRPRSKSTFSTVDGEITAPTPHSRLKDVHELSQEARRKLAFDMLMKDEDEALAKAYSAILGIKADEQAAAEGQRSADMHELESWAPPNDSLVDTIEAEPAMSRHMSVADEDKSDNAVPSEPEYLAPQFEIELEKELRKSIRAEEYLLQMQTESQRERMDLMYNTYADGSADDFSVYSGSQLSGSMKSKTMNGKTYLSQSLSLPTLKKSPTKVAPEIDRVDPLPQRKRKFPRTFFHSDVDYKHRFNNLTLPALVDNGRGSDAEALSRVVLKDALLTKPAKIRQEVRSVGLLMDDKGNMKDRNRFTLKSPLSIPMSRGDGISRGGSVYSSGGSLVLSFPPVGAAFDDRSFEVPPTDKKVDFDFDFS